MKTKIFYFLVIAFLVGGCARSYTSQYQAFPPGTVPHEKGWSHLCQVVTWAKHRGPITRKGPKNIEIIIKDNVGKILLGDEVSVESASTRPEIEWTKFENVRVVVYETGNEYSEDDYNRALVKGGPKLLLTLSYTYNQTAEKFERRSLTLGSTGPLRAP